MDQRGLSISSTAPSGSVRIMSIHKSKGLEFPVVFLCGLSRTFNTADIQKQVLCNKELGLGLIHTNPSQRVRFPTIAKRAISAKIVADSVSEELRVLYVAMTRARDRLIMTYAASRLEEQLKEIVYRLDLSSHELLTAHVNCPGSWILMTALQRTEAGALFQISDKPECVSVRNDPWNIHVVEAGAISGSTPSAELEPHTLSQDIIEKMRTGLTFRYPHQQTVKIPSKITATQLKGRAKDQEAAEFTENHQHPLVFRMPSGQARALRGAEYGNALHSVMQYLDFRCCSSVDDIRQDIKRMESRGLITSEQAVAVDAEKIHRFFNTELGIRLRNASEVLREFKFSILEEACNYFSDVNDEAILLQGVIDCALVEPDGITVLDFKTDFINESNLAEKTALYKEQVCTYAKALSRIYKMPVVASYIYFFSSEQLIRIE